MEFYTTTKVLSGYDGKDFCLPVILHTAEHSVLVYSDPDDYCLTCMNSGYSGATILSAGATQVGIAWSPEFIMITPRGSSEGVDWIDDILSVVKSRWDGVLPEECKVGYGFLRQAKAISDDLVGWVRYLKERNPDAKIVVSGHSLGGALVPLIVSLLWHHDYSVLFAVQHESPRVGNMEFAKWYDDTFTNYLTRTWSVVNLSGNSDSIVVRVPKKRWDFRHIGIRTMLARDRVIFGESLWLEYRKENPVTNTIAAWRIFTRSVVWAINSVRTHLGSSLIATLRLYMDSDWTKHCSHDSLLHREDIEKEAPNGEEGEGKR